MESARAQVRSAICRGSFFPAKTENGILALDKRERINYYYMVPPVYGGLIRV